MWHPGPRVRQGSMRVLRLRLPRGVGVLFILRLFCTSCSRCRVQICEEWEEEVALLELWPDMMVTPAGTYRPVYGPPILGPRSGAVVACGGFVLAPADPVSERPATIVIDLD